MTTNFDKVLSAKLLSGSQVLWIYIPGDEGRAVRQLEKFAADFSKDNNRDLRFYTWNPVTGASWDPQVTAPDVALQQAVTKLAGDGMILMKDMAAFMNGQGPKNLELRRRLIEACIPQTLNSTTTMRPFVFLSHNPTPHEEISEFCDVIDFELPHYDDMAVGTVKYILDSTQNACGGKALLGIDEEVNDKIVRALLGLTSVEAERVLAYSLSRSGGNVKAMFDLIAAEKAIAIRKIEGLRFIPYDKIPDSSHIGGFGTFMEWLRKRARAYTRHAQSVGLELPRGAVLIGPPGTGKTFVAKAAAKLLGLDLMQMDIGSTGPINR